MDESRSRTGASSRRGDGDPDPDAQHLRDSLDRLAQDLDAAGRSFCRLARSRTQETAARIDRTIQDNPRASALGGIALGIVLARLAGRR